MGTRKINLSVAAGDKVAVKRRALESHLDHCETCYARQGFCDTAQMLWRTVVLAAIRQGGQL